MKEQLTGRPMIRVAGEWMTEAQYAQRMAEAQARYAVSTYPPYMFFVCNGF